MGPVIVSESGHIPIEIVIAPIYSLHVNLRLAVEQYCEWTARC